LAALAPGRAAIEWAAERQLDRRLRGLGVAREPVVMVSNIYCPGVLSRLSKKLVVYDFNDHPLQFSGVPGWASAYWPRTRDQVDLFYVVGEHYRRQLVQETSKPVMTLGNGVEYGEFAAPRPVPADLGRLPRPRIGYLGLLSHFLDFEVLEAIRQARRGGTLVLIGPDSPATREPLARLAAREGVALLGPKPYAEVPAYMQGLDVGLIPFRAQDPYVQGINPNKVYQYLAAGLPVVTTPILDLTPSPPHLQPASEPAAWVAAVERALAAPPDREARQALARPHDWSALAARMVAGIESRLGAAA
jgi:glycosyltransferase involved in cell wall biosynthesis